MEFKDYYKTLGVSREASQDELQKAYRKLAREFHPDINKTKGAEDRFKEINEANEVLSDPQKRQRYDTLASGWRPGKEFTPPPGWESQFSSAGPSGHSEQFDFSGMSDFFSTFFGGHGNAMPRRDQEAELEISVEEAINGSTRVLRLSGEGKERTVKVKIPPMTAPGSRIRLAGQGNNSDLYLRIRVPGSELGRVNGADIVVPLQIAPWEAALGAKIDLKLPGGAAVKVTVPAGTQSGSRLRLRDKGLSKGGEARGDALVELQVTVPKKLSDRERELFQELKEVSQFNPREAR